MTVAQWSGTASLNVLSSGTSGTGGTNIDEGMARSDVNNAMRDIMSQIATWRTAATIGGFFSQTVIGHTAALSIGGNSDNFEVFGTTAATGGLAIGMFSATPATSGHLDFYKSANASIGSATVVASGDNLGALNWYGAQQTGTFATQTMAAQIRAEADGTVTSGASGDMPGRLVFATTADAGSAVTDRLILDAAGILKPNANDGVALGTTALSYADLFLASGGVINWNASDVTITHSANALTFAGASNGYLFDAAVIPQSNDGAALGSTANSWSDAFFASGAVLNFNNGDVTLTHAANQLTFGGASSGYLFDAVTAPSSNDGAALGSTTNQWSDLFLASGSVLNFGGSDLTVVHSATILDFSAGKYRFGSSGTSTPGSGNNSSGVVIDSSGTIYSSRGGNSAVFNRTADGNLININSGGTNQGIISVSGATVTYGAFFGSHWSQTADGSKPDILRGTIVESLDEMCAWPGEGPEERLPRFKISDEVGSRAVYGVFAWWEISDEESPATNDAFIGSLGAFVIRIAPGINPKRGDYIKSNGDGCGRVQDDDVFRASTVAKITSAIPVDTYPDGSRLFPCTLHCG